MEETPVAIIGGGISGLAAAYFLGKAGIRSTIVEKAGRLGGLIRTEKVQECVLEAGPDSYLGTKPAATQLARELGAIGEEIVGSNDAERRVYIVRKGRLTPLPRGMVMMAPAEWRPALTSQLFSVSTKLRFLRETLTTPRGRAEDISVRDFVAAHFGGEVVQYVAEPLLAGVYGGAAEDLSAASVLPRFLAYERDYGSLIRGVRQERKTRARGASMFLSFRSGMQQLTDALAQAAAPFTRIVYAEAQILERRENGWRVQAGEYGLDARETVLACPAHAAARLVEAAVPDLAAELASIPYSSAILVTLVYRSEQIRHPLNGFGFLIPRTERRTISAATWVHRKFPCRIPRELAALRAFIVDPEASRLAGSPEKRTIQLVREDFERLLGIDAEPLFSSVHSWPASMPQYIAGHEARRKRILDLAEATPGISLAGNYLGGIGIPDCVQLARQAAMAIETRLTNLS